MSCFGSKGRCNNNCHSNCHNSYKKIECFECNCHKIDDCERERQDECNGQSQMLDYEQ